MIDQVLTVDPNLINDVKYDEKGLVPAIVQDMDNGEILMMAYANKESLQLTIDSGLATFWSRSRQEIWTKGATSGNTIQVEAILLDCDGDTLVFLAHPSGPACHTGDHTCFSRVLAKEVKPMTTGCSGCAGCGGH